MADTLALHIRWQQLPGYVKEPIDAHGPEEVIAAILRQVCEHPSFALRGVESIEVKRDG